MILAYVGHQGLKSQRNNTDGARQLDSPHYPWRGRFIKIDVLMFFSS